ncbi:hypothetical protein AAEY27_10065 [Kosakonia sp. BYX6]|uniref:Phosphodiester glycosidase domain-containing protein n=1 Tax=Kosakonia calanthes TaxID=3139408 RepID=A0ABZ3BA38_9ENTR
MHRINPDKSELLPAFLACLLFGSSFAISAELHLNQYDKLETIEGVTSNKEVEAQLKKLLGDKYDDFILNFDLYGEPHHTADGGLFVEGFLQHLALENASAFVIYPDGKLSAAWVLPGEKMIHYRTNRAEKGINRDIQQWASKFDDKTFETLPAQSADLFSGKWQGDDDFTSTFSLKLLQQNNKLTGSYCFITRGGNRIDCADEEQNNLSGEAKNNVATITFDSTFGGKNGKATLVVDGEKMQWQLTQPPAKGNYYAPESYHLVKDHANAGAAARLLSTSKFTIAIRNNCGVFSTPCDDMLYTGVRNSDNTMISLKGKTVRGRDNRVVGSEFSNGNVTYRVNYQPPELIVAQGKKILVNQPAQWQK